VSSKPRWATQRNCGVQFTAAQRQWRTRSAYDGTPLLPDHRRHILPGEGATCTCQCKYHLAQVYLHMPTVGTTWSAQMRPQPHMDTYLGLRLHASLARWLNIGVACVGPDQCLLSLYRASLAILLMRRLGGVAAAVALLSWSALALALRLAPICCR